MSLMQPSLEDFQAQGQRTAPNVTRGGPIVAFDFDGTLTTKDSFKAFLLWREGTRGYGLGMARLIPAAMRWLKNRDPGKLKAAAVRTFLKGVPRAAIEDEAIAFAKLAAPRLLRPDAVKVFRRHRQHGARLAIVTASPEIIVAPFARGLGADVLIGTRLRFDAHDKITGELEGQNCIGPEKVRRLQDVFGQNIRLLAAYGDSPGDKEMLDLADEKYMRLFVLNPVHSQK